MHRAQVWLFTVTNRPVLVSESFPVSKSNRPPLSCPWGCVRPFQRRQEWSQHILDHHLPHSLYCLNPACAWQGSRKEGLYEHIDQGKCGPRPEFEEQRMIYDTKLILGWIRDGVPIYFVYTFAVNLVEERAKELDKVNLWQNQ
jgi:hypothetical protein